MTKKIGFSNRLRSRRIEMGLSQRDLGKLANIAAPQLSRYEAGGAIPRFDIAAKLARVLGVNFEWLLTGTGEKEFDGNATHPLKISLTDEEDKYLHSLARAKDIDSAELLKKMLMEEVDKYLVELSAQKNEKKTITEFSANSETKMKVLRLNDTTIRLIHGEGLHYFDVDYSLPLWELATILEPAFVIARRNDPTLLNKYKNKPIKLHSGSSHLDFIVEGEGSINFLIIEDHFSRK